MEKWASRGVPAGIWDLGPSGTQGVRETSSGPRGVTGGSPRGVDVKPLLRGGPGTPDPGYPGSETPVSRLARGTPFPGVWGPGPSGTPVPGIRDPEPPGIPGIPGSALRSSGGLPPPPGEGSGEVDVKGGVPDPENAKKAIFHQKRPKMPKYGYLPAFCPILTESASIYKNRNRRGFQSNLDFLALLEIRGPGRPQNGRFRDFGVWDPSFYINLSRRPPRNPRRGKWRNGPPAGSRRGFGIWDPPGPRGSGRPPRDPGELRGGRREGLM